MSAKDEDADVGDDALQQLLNETERLMHDLDTKDETKPALVIEGFSIDSDEEGDESGTNTKVDAGDHPLSEEWLSTPAPASAPHTSPISAPLPSTMPSLFANGGTAESSVASPAAGATMDSLKQQTTRFASNLASMAQRAASQVAAAAAPVQVTGAPTVTQAQSFPGQAFTGLSQEPSQIIQEPKATPTNSSDLSKEQKAQLIKDYAGEMLPGEHIIMFVSNLLHVSDTSGVSYAASQSSDAFMWCCAMSYYRLILFSTLPDAHTNHPPPPGWSPVCWPPAPVNSKLLEIPLASIDRVEKTVYQASGSSYMGLVVYAKDCCRTIRFTTPSYADTGRAYDSLNTYAFPGRRNLGYLFAFESKREEVMASVKVDEKSGQQSITIAPTSKRFDPMIEFPRLLSKASITQSPWIIWASINSTYQMSPTYPSVLVGPATLDETKPESQHVIRQCAAFRSEQRLPSMTWCNIGGASIWRSSQPKVGLQGNRSPADELFLRHVAESARGANAMAEPPPIYPKSVLQQLTGSYSKDWVPEPGCGLKILDLRPRSAAMANRTGGYGYENTSNYPNTTLQFCNIPNIHAVRDGYQKLCSVCNGKSTSDVSWNSLIEDTKWLSYVRMILAASWETAYWVHVWRMPVLLHCSHGWDRTSQVAALAQLFLDPFYRTCQGFSVLVEKDFMSFGHPFHTRCAHGEGRGDKSSLTQASANDEGQISPVFMQFLDCVYQIVQLYPDSFEFNTKYLLELSFHVYSCRFGSMLCDTEREREVLAGIRQRTYSVWDFLDANRDLKNENFNEAGVLLMPLPTLLRNVTLWSDRHCFFSPKPTRRPSFA